MALNSQLCGRWLWMWLLVAVTLAASSSARAADSPDAAKDRPTLIPGGIASPDGKVGFVVNVKRGVDALQLATGELLATAATARRPLIVWNERLVAQMAVKDNPHAMKLALFDAAQLGSPLLETEAIALPEWASLAKAHAHSFVVESRLVGDAVVLRWRAETWYGGGEKLTEAEERAAHKVASGAVKMDLHTGKIQTRDDREPVELPEAREPREVRLGERRLALGEVAGPVIGVGRATRRSIRASDPRTDKLLWEHELEPEIVLPTP